MIIPKTETLEIQIAKARELLSEDSKRAIDAVNWKLIIQGMNKKFNVEQLENLETETELLLCGLVNTINYPKELETRMKIPKVEISLLLSEMDKLIFKKIQEELEKRINRKDEKEKVLYTTNKPLILDPRFAGLPKDIQKAIALSGWKEILYTIIREYKVTVDKMGLLEEITIKRLLGIIPVDQYNSEISSKVGLPEDKTKELVVEINEKIFKNIKEKEEKITNYEYYPIGDSTESGIKNENIPLPPYAKTIKNEEKMIKNEEKTPIINNKEDIYREHGIEILSDDEFTPPVKTIKNYELGIRNEEKIIKNEEVVFASPPAKEIKNYELGIRNEEKPKETNIITNKLFGNTASKATVSDYSLPKMSGEPQSNPHDPYHEEV